jgi:hypothetical protein
MPSSAQHRDKADRNRAFLGTLKGGANPEWVAVVAFYTALHLVERLAACDSIHNSKHTDRLDYLKKHENHRAIHADFLALFDASLVARYGTVNQFGKAFPGDTVDKVLVGRHLDAIEKYVATQFPPPPAPTAAGS